MVRETYEVERFLGEGAFAEVYRVKHRFLGRQAMKVFKRTGIKISEVNDILYEAILLSRIGHPNIVRVFDANVFDGLHGVCGYFTMEYVPGGTLDKFWHSFGAQLVPIATTLDLIIQVCRGISLGHGESPPLIHRDIKPQNILVGYEIDGLRARVSDFGLARKVNPLTMLASAAGTLAFKPPETFISSRADSCSADVWAIGVTLYLLLTDKLPFSATGGAKDRMRHEVDNILVPASQINPDADIRLDVIVSRALARRPADRFQTAKELLDALEKWEPEKYTVARDPESLAPSSEKVGVSVASPIDEKIAQALVAKAFVLRDAGRLGEAGDAMEEAFNKWPTLRSKFSKEVQLWRRGISM